MPVLPLGDDNPHGESSPVNWAFILLALGACAVTLAQDGNLSLAALEGWMLPLTAHFPPDAEMMKRLAASLFIHENPWQMALYLYMLWMLGDNIEYAMGHLRYAVFFLLCGLGGLIAQLWLAPVGNTLAFAGLGAAAFAVTGAYIACFPRIKIDIIWFFRENYFSVKLLPGIFLLLDMLASLWHAAGSFGQIPALPLLQHFTLWALHAAAFVLGYGMFFLFRDKSVVIEMPLHQRKRIRTGGSDDWRGR